LKDKPAHRRHDADDRAHGGCQQQEQHEGTQPAEQCALPVFQLGHGAQGLRGLALGRGNRPCGFKLRIRLANHRGQRGVTLRKALDRGFALDVGAHQEFPQPDDVP